MSAGRSMPTEVKWLTSGCHKDGGEAMKYKDNILSASLPWNTSVLLALGFTHER